MGALTPCDAIASGYDAVLMLTNSDMEKFADSDG
jgi:hypothetical protein